MWGKQYLRKFNLAIAYKNRREKRLSYWDRCNHNCFQVHTIQWRWQWEWRKPMTRNFQGGGGRETSVTVDMNGVENTRKQKKNSNSWLNLELLAKETRWQKWGNFSGNWLRPGFKPEYHSYFGPGHSLLWGAVLCMAGCCPSPLASTWSTHP